MNSNEMEADGSGRAFILREVETRWQKMLDLLAKQLDIAAFLIVTKSGDQLEVLASSRTPGNYFRKGDRLGMESYCGRVIKEQSALLIHNAKENPEWAKTSACERGLTYYSGFPLFWPDGSICGTICILNRTDHPQADQLQELFSEISNEINRELQMLAAEEARETLARYSGLLQDSLPENIAQMHLAFARFQEKNDQLTKLALLVSGIMEAAPEENPFLGSLDRPMSEGLDSVSRLLEVDGCGIYVPAGSIGNTSTQILHSGDESLFAKALAAALPRICNRFSGSEAAVLSGKDLTDAIKTEPDDRRSYDGASLISVPVTIKRHGKESFAFYFYAYLENSPAGRWPSMMLPLSIMSYIFVHILVARHDHVKLAIHARLLSTQEKISRLGSWEWNIQNDVHVWSDGFYRILGWAPGEIKPGYESLLSLVHPEDREAFDRANRESVARHDVPYFMQYRIIAQNGAIRWLNACADIYAGADGRLVRMIGTLQDVTEMKIALDSLQSGEQKYRELVEQAKNIILRWNNKFIITFANEYALKFLGYEAGGLVGADVKILLPATDEKGTDLGGLAQRLITNPEELVNNINENVCRDGTRVWISWTNSAILDENGNVQEILAVGNDVTRALKAELELEKAYQQISSLNEQLASENLYLREESRIEVGDSEVIGASDQIKDVLKLTMNAAQTDVPVLFTGETGAGKDVFARYLVRKSRRSGRPFVKLNCAALPANLVESELFGREKGAYTGATDKQMGRFEIANGGTIFLDEIGEIPLELQAKLLRVIEHGEFERLGNPRTVKVDVRIIASTNRNLEEEIKQGRFRSDLFYRLGVFQVRIPPLRERKGDIALLVRAFTAGFSSLYAKNIQKIPLAAMEKLERYSWPGNVRELQNVIERSVILSTGETFQIAAGFTGKAEIPDDNSQITNLVEIEKSHILKILKMKNWRIEGPNGAAILLGMNPNTLRGRMSKLGIARTG